MMRRTGPLWMVVGLLMIGGSQAMPSPGGLHSPSLLGSLMARADPPAYPNEVKRKYNRYVALGDSYSAGPGYGRAGNPVKAKPGDSPPYDKNCAQNDASWPAQLNEVLKPKEFQFSACTGYTTQQIRQVEIQDKNSNFGDPDLVTLTMGGNNNQAFLSVVIACAFTESLAGCSAAIWNAQRTVNGIDKELEDTIEAAATQNITPGNNRTVLVMGYPQLYNNGTSLSLNCNLNSWRRAQINQLVVQVNAKLQSRAEAVNARLNGPKALFADPNAPERFAKGKARADGTFYGHRFCELWNWAYLNGGAPPEDMSLADILSPPNVLDTLKPLYGLQLMNDAKNTGWAYAQGLFHPIKMGHTIMADAARNVLSTDVPPDDASKASAPGDDLLVIPKASSNVSARTDFQKHLGELIGDPTKIWTINSTSDGPLMWKVSLNEAQINDIKTKEIIGSIVQDQGIQLLDIGKGVNAPDPKNAPIYTPSTSSTASATSNTASAAKPGNADSAANAAKRAEPSISGDPNDYPAILQTSGNVMYHTGGADLSLLSQPYTEAGKPPDGNFYFDQSAGNGSTVYVIDSGATPDHPAFKSMTGKTRWIMTGQGWSKADSKEVDWHDAESTKQGHGHGTCSVSLVASRAYGTAKNVNMVVVKLQSAKAGLGMSSLFEAFVRVRDDIAGDLPGKSGKAVVSLSVGVPGDYDPFFLEALREQVKSIVDMNVTIVAAAGNPEEQSSANGEINSYPQLWATEIDGVINVGATDNEGKPHKSSASGSRVSIWAPGDSVSCANSKYDAKDAEHTYAQKLTGTSMAAPRVAGIVAYLQGLVPPGQPLKAPNQLLFDLQTLGWQRYNTSDPATNGKVQLAWNGMPYPKNLIRCPGSDGCDAPPVVNALDLTKAWQNGTDYWNSFAQPLQPGAVQITDTGTGSSGVMDARRLRCQCG